MMKVFVLINEQGTDASNQSTVQLFLDKEAARAEMRKQFKAELPSWNVDAENLTDDQECECGEDTAVIRNDPDSSNWRIEEKELDVQMERFGYQLQMSGYSMEQYAKMMGGDVNTMRNAFRPTAEKQAKISVTLEKIAEVENLTVTAEDIEEEFQSMAKQYEMEEDKIKEMVPMDELTESLKTRKAVKLIVDSAVAVAPKTEEKTEE